MRYTYPYLQFFYYLDNKGRYVDALTGKKNYANIKSDLIKLFTIFSISEIIYSVSKVSIHFQLMQISFEPYQATMIASIHSMVDFSSSNKFRRKSSKVI